MEPAEILMFDLSGMREGFNWPHLSPEIPLFHLQAVFTLQVLTPALLRIWGGCESFTSAVNTKTIINA